MTLEEYVGRFRLLQHSAEKDERRLALLSAGAYQGFVHRFAASASPLLSSLLVSEEKLRRDYAKKQRLCERYALRLTRAISLMEPGEKREYALFHYLYGLTHEQIAEQSFFSVRTVYRYAKKAREELEEALKKVKPRHVRTSPARYRIRGTLPRKKLTADRITRSVIACTALRRSERYRTSPIFA